jgi:hypothetical protein
MWPRCHATTDEHLVLDITTGRGFRAESCDFWDANLLPGQVSVPPLTIVSGALVQRDARSLAAVASLSSRA